MVSSRQQGPRRAFALMQLLAVIAIIAILIGRLSPGVQKIHEAANPMSVRNKLKRLALSCHNFESAYGTLPGYQPATSGSSVASYGHSVHVFILPGIGQENPGETFDPNSQQLFFGSAPFGTFSPALAANFVTTAGRRCRKKIRELHGRTRQASPSSGVFPWTIDHGTDFSSPTPKRSPDGEFNQPPPIRLRSNTCKHVRY